MIIYRHSLEKENGNAGKNNIKNLFMETVKCLGDSWCVSEALFIMQKIKLSTLQ